MLCLKIRQGTEPLTDGGFDVLGVEGAIAHGCKSVVFVDMSSENTKSRVDANEKALTPWGQRISSALAGRPIASLAREAGINPTSLRDMMTRVTPNAEAAVRVSRALGVSVEWLITGEGPVVAPPAPGEDLRQPSQGAIKAVGARLREVHQLVDEAISAAGGEIPEGLRQCLLALALRYRIEAEDIALLVACLPVLPDPPHSNRA